MENLVYIQSEKYALSKFISYVSKASKYVKKLRYDTAILHCPVCETKHPLEEMESTDNVICCGCGLKMQMIAKILAIWR